ncbi:DUF2834 domain-containing protein [Pseudopelagicola sp. nBUS_20]|uniref:DUF2834 domain-containing protein n=1 Tax=Pseudopelagicola sp. nBUS_20 TaxID=3395317 RepID=UPI003EBD0A89
MSLLRLIFLALAIWGAVHPMSFFGPWIVENGLNIEKLVADWKTSKATTGLYWDLVISAITLTVWIVAEVAVRRNFLALVAIPATVLIGVSCGLPLYLYLRSKPIT